jgi:hypothetical protein
VESLPFRIEKFIDKQISPAGRLQEIIYALIMVITVSSTVSGAVPDTEEGIRTLIFAILGCNIAWGIVDGVMFVLTNLFNRNKSLKMVEDATSAITGEEALSVIDGEFNPPFEWMMGEDERKKLNEEILDHVMRVKPPVARITMDDITGGMFCFVVTFLTTLPAVLPFYFIGDMGHAIRLSNGIVMTMLFFTGVEYARYTNKNPLKTAVGLTLLGGVVVVITILLGG